MSNFADKVSLKKWLKSMGVEGPDLGDTPTNWHDLAKRAEELTPQTDVTRPQKKLSSPVQKPHVTSKTTHPTTSQPLSNVMSPPLKPELLNPKVQQATARQLASSASTLEELRKLMVSFEGCALKQTALNTVFGDGNPQADLMLVGEAPGADEDRQGKPFVGMSGQLLSKALQTIGIKDRQDYYITNMIPWRPPGNRQPSSTELAACLPFVQKHIELVQPKVLAFVGGVSAKTLLDTTMGITKMRGQTMYYTCPLTNVQTRAIALYHPAYLLRSPSKKEIFWHDLLTLKSLLATL